MIDFTDQVIVITGAAGNLGNAVAKSFLEQNGIVCGIDHRKGRMEDLKNFPTDQGKFYPFEDIDVTDSADMAALVDKIHDQVGTIDILVNTVGGFSMGESVHEMSDEMWQRMMDLNVHSFLSTTSAIVPDMIKKNRGKVISIGSKAALNGSANTGAYAAAKGALLRLTESMAEELRDKSIQVNSVLPGTIDTPENRQAMPNSDYSKWVSPEQVAKVILFLSSSASDGITGTAIPVNGCR
jgi:NAD(P)-dependent dehydrogenase (short-subunit alcohol dehydrogenase family)